MSDLAQRLADAGIEVKPLRWGEVMPPSEECRYDHVDGFGPHTFYRIEWKSWKDYPDYTVGVAIREGWGEDFVTSANTIEAAKAAAQADYEARILASLQVKEGRE